MALVSDVDDNRISLCNQIEFVFSLSDASEVSAARSFFGLAKTSGLLANANPSALTNIFGVAHDTTDTKWQIMHNDNSGTASKIDTGWLVNPPAPASVSATPTLYRLALRYYNLASSGLVQQWVFDKWECTQDNPYRYAKSSLSGTITTDKLIEFGGDAIFFQTWRNNGANAVAVAFDLHSIKQTPMVLG